MNNKRIGFIGGGQIAQAVIEGLINGEHLKDSTIWISCPSANDENSSLKRFGNSVQRTTSNLTLCSNVDVVVLAVKARLSRLVCTELSKELDESQISKILFVSVVPGLKISTLSRWLGSSASIIRIMYNLGVAKGSGSYALTTSNHRNKESETFLRSLFDKLAFFAGYVSEVELDISCALLGSGPAFFCTAVEGLADGAVKAGLSRPLANTLAARAMLASADLLVSTSKSASELKQEVATPAGTTIYGLYELENRSVRAAYMDSLMSAFNRAQTMAEQLDKIE